MPRTLLPPVLALLLAPALAYGAPADPSGSPGHHQQATSARSDGVRAERRQRGGGSQGSDKGDSRSRSGGSRGSRGSGGSRDGGRDGGSRDGGDRDRESAERRDGPYARPDAGRPQPQDRDDRGGDRDDRDARSDSGHEEARDAERRDGPSARPDAGRPMGAEAGRPEAARPEAGRPMGAEGRTVRSFEGGARPTPAKPTVRRVTVGTPVAAGHQPATQAISARSAAPPNFRSSVGREDARREEARHDGASHASAERHGDRGSDATRATYGSHAESERYHAAERHARATAATHRHEAAWHREAAARHHAWAASRYRRYHRWYAPGGWFAPWRPGHAYWYHGVFVYGPYPWWHHDHVVVVEGDAAPAEGAEPREEQGPRRAVDRTRTFAVGLRGGSYMGAYDFGGGGFGDAGLGLAVRYRPVEAVGLELSWMHHDQTWDTGSERVYQPIQASVELFAAPWTRVNPYVLAGVTVASRQVHDDVGFTQVDEASTLWGPHAGLGIEFGIGQKASVNFDVRYAGYLNKPQGDLTIPGAFQGNMGLNFYF